MADAHGRTSFSRSELQRRRNAVASEMERRGCDRLVTLSSATIQWLTQYALVPNERPFALLLDDRGELTLYVPLLKAQHARLDAYADRIETYAEYPGDVHPLQQLADLIMQRPPRYLFLESQSHSSLYGYPGPLLTDLLGDIRWTVDPWAVQRLRMVKSAEEVEALRHSAAWAVFAHGELQKAISPNTPESSVAGQATGAAMRALLARHGADTSAVRPMRVFAGFGGQVGADGTAHHAPRTIDPILAPGDLLVTQVGAFVAGYYADIERTMAVGRPTSPARDLFELGVEIQAFALDLVRPGASCADIDRAVSKRFERSGVGDLWRHHVGHSLGVLIREPPYLDRGDATTLEPGMVVTVEPGLYKDGVGGFRHSDLVLVTENGAEILTEYPRDLGSLSC